MAVSIILSQSFSACWFNDSGGIGAASSGCPADFCKVQWVCKICLLQKDDNVNDVHKCPYVLQKHNSCGCWPCSIAQCYRISSVDLRGSCLGPSCARCRATQSDSHVLKIVFSKHDTSCLAQCKNWAKFTSSRLGFLKRRW